MRRRRVSSLAGSIRSLRLSSRKEVPATNSASLEEQEFLNRGTSGPTLTLIPRSARDFSTPPCKGRIRDSNPSRSRISLPKRFAIGFAKTESSRHKGSKNLRILRSKIIRIVIRNGLVFDEKQRYGVQRHANLSLRKRSECNALQHHANPIK